MRVLTCLSVCCGCFFLRSTITYGIWGEKEIVQYILLAFLAVELFTIIGVYVYFAVNNPDCLRSETFTLSKLAMEKGHIGDGVNGIEQREPDQHQTPVIIGVKDD